MAKFPKSFTLEKEIIEKLESVQNASDLVNTLLFNHFNQDTFTKKMSLYDKLEIVEQEKEGILLEMSKEIENKEEEAKRMYEQVNKMRDLQISKLKEEIALIEVEEDLCIEFMKYATSLDKITTGTEILDWIGRFREKGITGVGVKQLERYYLYKTIGLKSLILNVDEKTKDDVINNA